MTQRTVCDHCGRDIDGVIARVELRGDFVSLSSVAEGEMPTDWDLHPECVSETREILTAATRCIPTGRPRG